MTDPHDATRRKPVIAAGAAGVVKIKELDDA